MIKINLIKKEEKKRGVSIPSLDLSALKGLRVENLFKKEYIHYGVSVIVGILFLVEVVYYFLLTNERNKMQETVQQLQAEKTALDRKVKKIKEEKERLEKELKMLQARIENIKQRKEIILALKGFYVPYNKYMSIYISSLPSTVWLTMYKQSFNLNEINMEGKISAFDIPSINSVIDRFKFDFDSIYFDRVTRKVNKYGVAYYSSVLKVKKKIHIEEKKEEKKGEVE